jgi:hypothetical protein
VSRSAKEPGLITASALVATSAGGGPKTKGAWEPFPHTNQYRRNKSERENFLANSALISHGDQVLT